MFSVFGVVAYCNEFNWYFVMKNIYADLFLNASTQLDKYVKSGEYELRKCVIKIMEKDIPSDIFNLQDKLSIISKSYHDNDNVTKYVKLVRDSLVQYYGYKKLYEICNKEFTSPEILNNNISLPQLMKDLNSLVGLNRVKEKVNSLISYQKIQQLRKTKGLFIPKSTLHLAFTGNPGTGKTTVARIIGQIYKQLGLLSSGHFLEVSRTDLIAGYQGQTALKVKEVMNKSKGGVLFIDEAYSITENDNTDSYGRECLTELTKALEDYRDDLVVIVAGYTEPMKHFFQSNPGLQSRFNTFIEFDDYNEEELAGILISLCHDNDYSINNEILVIVRSYFQKIILQKDANFSNGRFVRNLFEDMVMNHAKRVSQLDNPTISDLKEILTIDVLPLLHTNISSI